jgi:hypothetical protein
LIEQVKNVKSFLSEVKNSVEKFSNKSNLMKNGFHKTREKRIDDFLENVFINSSIDCFYQMKILFSFLIVLFQNLLNECLFHLSHLSFIMIY